MTTSQTTLLKTLRAMILLAVGALSIAACGISVDTVPHDVEPSHQLELSTPP